MFHEDSTPIRWTGSGGDDVTVVTSATTDEEGRALLRRLGFPFKEN